MEDTDNDEILDNNSLKITIEALGVKTRDTISSLLNPRKILKSDCGHLRDWQGLAELCEIPSQRLPSLREHSNPTTEVLNLWLEHSKTEATIEKLFEFLEKLDRYDIIDDIKTSVEEDIKQYNENPNQCVDLCDGDLDKVLTVDDQKNKAQGLGPQHYNAYVLFAGEDTEFAIYLVETMEKRYNVKFCYRDRDLLPGVLFNDSVENLIAKRCTRVIIIVSPTLFSNSSNKWFYTFSHAMTIEKRQRKIIPCIYKECEELPLHLTCYFLLDYRSKYMDFWEKLYEAVVTEKPEISESRQQEYDNLARSVAEYNFQPNAPEINLEPAFHKNDSTLSPQNHELHNNSLTEIIQENIMPSPEIQSRRSEGNLADRSVKKCQSFFKGWKKMRTKTKSGNEQVSLYGGLEAVAKAENVKKKKNNKKKVALLN